MIGPGSLPRPFARYGVKRRLAYVRPRPRRRPPHGPRRELQDPVCFDHRPPEFPTAALVPHDSRERAFALAGELARWLASCWTWLRPRLVPGVAAAFGALVMIATADYMTRAHGEPATASPADVGRAAPPPAVPGTIDARGPVSCSISHR